MFNMATLQIRKKCEPKNGNKNHECHKRNRQEIKNHNSRRIRTTWKNSALTTWSKAHNIVIFHYPSLKMKIIMITSKKSSKCRKRHNRKLISTNFFKKSKKYNKLNWKHENPLPPAEFTHEKSKSPLICESKNCSPERKRSDKCYECKIIHRKCLRTKRARKNKR